MEIINFEDKIVSSGNYFNLTGNIDLQRFMTTYHSEAIKSGNKVDKRLIKSYIGKLPIFIGEDVNSLDKILNLIKENPNGLIIFKGYILDSNKGKKIEIDFLVLKDNVIYCCELKEGNNFDTKKSKSEIDNLEKIEEIFKQHNFNVSLGFVCMNVKDEKHLIKDKRAKKYFINGFNFCEKFNFNYNEYNQLIIKPQLENEKKCFEFLEEIINKYKQNNKFYATTM